MLQGKKTVSSEQMRRIEKLAYSSGYTEESFMEAAGKSIATLTVSFAQKHQRKKIVYLLVGKGNNGGDALAAGLFLLEHGFKVKSIELSPPASCSSLSQKYRAAFLKKGGESHLFQPEEFIPFEQGSVILDGLLGTGFQGKVEEPLASLIVQANNSKLPILALDIPSGLNATTGEVLTVAIYATQTLYLGLPKVGFFLKKGWDYVGELVEADFGLPKAFILQAQEEFYLLAENQLSLPPLHRSRHKYETGYVLAIAGSVEMKGAAALSTLASLRAGAGIVRLFHLAGMQTSGVAAEVVHEEFDAKRVLEESKRAKSLLVGPGLGRTKEVKKLLSTLLPMITLPTVLDADALFFLAEDSSLKPPAQAILTPHHQEMSRLLGGKPPSLALCQEYAQEHLITLILKGAPTFIFHPHEKPLVVPRGDPGMATAGSGDVLTGILAAFLAQGLAPHSAAALGVYLHALAGEKAAAERTSYSLIASDLICKLGDAFKVVSLKG